MHKPKRSLSSVACGAAASESHGSTGPSGSPFSAPLFDPHQCCIGLTGTFDGDFAPLDNVLVSPGSLTINFNTPVQAVGAQIQNNTIGTNFLAEILAFNGNQLLGAFLASGFSGDVADNSNPFLGVLTFLIGGSSSGPVAINHRARQPGGPRRPRTLDMGDDDPRLRWHWLHGLSAEGQASVPRINDPTTVSKRSLTA
jgi:hypothetical protein